MKIITKYALMLVVLLIASNIATQAQNLISNAGFENGMTGWATNKNGGSTVSFAVENSDSPEGNKHLMIEVEKLGTNDWDIQLRSNEFWVDQSHEYKVTFKAKAGANDTELKIYLQKSAWMGTAFTLTDTWETYTYEFFPNEASKQLKFNFTDVADYYIDSIIVEDKTPASNMFNTPPSCVITAPYVNAYFKKESEVTINAYASDLGGSGFEGEVTKVEFFVDEEKIGESGTSVNNTFSFIWQAQEVGEYRITCVATDNDGKSFTSAGVLVMVGDQDAVPMGLSAGKGKYLGNVVRNDGVEPTFTNYWNAVTSGNGGKWKTVERNRDVMNWTRGDEAYELAYQNHLPYRYHTIAWGSQYPDWIKTLDPDEFQEEMEEFIAEIAKRYKYIDQIDVVNEVIPGHQADTKYFVDGLGGAGESGYDWVVWLFKKSREYFPNAKLVVNDFGIVNSESSIRQQLQLLKVLRDSALVDGFGAQAHTFNLDYTNVAVLKQNLDIMASAGVPIYITEMDMQGASKSEASQLTSYKKLFPVLWEHPAIAGISLWGYIYGNMWQSDAGLVEKDGTERSSMVWLKDYLTNREDVGYPMGNIDKSWSAKISANTRKGIGVFPNPSSGMVTIKNCSDRDEVVKIFNSYGQLVDCCRINTSGEIHQQLLPGVYFVCNSKRETVKLLVK